MSQNVLPQTPAARLIRIAEVERTTGLKRPTIYRHMAAGTFPASIKLSPSCTAWSEAEVQAWIAQRIAASREAA
nr:AlpA family transcriptional regulator [Frateuria aurantia]